MHSIIKLFKTNKLYLYYLTGDKLISSTLELDFDNRFVRICNGFKKDMKKCAYYYEGNMEFDNSTMYINCTGLYSERVLEKVQIIFKILILNDIDNTFCFITGLTPSGIPVVKKGIIKVNPIQEIEKDSIYKMLQIDREQAKDISKENSWLLKEKDYPELFYELP